jgi:hypothetical protein
VRPRDFALSVAAALLLLILLPDAALAWTPGTHIFLGESVLANLSQLPRQIADLLRAYPYDFLYGNIAADTSIAKKYAPVGRHCHSWHVGREIFDRAESDGLRSFGLGYLAHLAADCVAHNFYVPRQLLVTSTTIALGHSYWERTTPVPTRCSIACWHRRSSRCARAGAFSAGWWGSPKPRAGSAPSGCCRTRVGGMSAMT